MNKPKTVAARMPTHIDLKKLHERLAATRAHLSSKKAEAHHNAASEVIRELEQIQRKGKASDERSRKRANSGTGYSPKKH